MNKKMISLATFFLIVWTFNLVAHLTIEDLQELTRYPKPILEKINESLETFEKFQEADWGGYYVVLPDLINKLLLKVGCEIGVAAGLHSKAILEKTHVKKLYSVDPYIPCSCMPLDMIGASEKHTQMWWEVYYLRTQDKLSNFGDRSHFIRATSREAVQYIADNELDFIFIDGNHEYAFVLEDLNLWYSKVRSGGLISGDDYCTIWPGVPQAINEFFASKGLKVNQHPQHPRVWWIIKP